MRNTDIYQTITDRIVGLLDAGTCPWQQPWDVHTGAPRNLITGRPYHGVNTWLLGCQRYASPYWATFKQIQEAGGCVTKGSKATPITFWHITTTDTGDGPVKRFLLRSYSVFNTAQCTDLDVPEPETRTHAPIEACEQLMAQIPQRATLVHGTEGAWYRPSTDTVSMPDPEMFHTPAAYYSTLFHELTHSTGHASRLNRDLSQMVRFGDVAYAKEELVAEMGAAYLCGVCGIDNTTVNQSAAYLKGWLRALRNDPKLFMQAAGQAQKAADFLQGITTPAVVPMAA